MATTTATITINSTDLLTDELALTSTTTLTTAGTSTGVTQTTGLARKTMTFASSGVIDSEVLYRSDDYTADKANKVYIKNTSTTPAEYFEIMITGAGGTAGGGVTELGRLYAGDWAFFPWNATGGTKETFIATIAGTWVAGETWEFDGVNIAAANTTAADIAAQIDAAQFPNWVTSRSGAAVTFVARESVDAGTVVTATADIVIVQGGGSDATSVVSSAAMGTKSLSDIYIKPSVHTGMTYETLLIHE
jgi:hypothetical protein